jgi:hypothetical protein
MAHQEGTLRSSVADPDAYVVKSPGSGSISTSSTDPDLDPSSIIQKQYEKPLFLPFCFVKKLLQIFTFHLEGQ